MKKKLFITGATGFVGSHALEYFGGKNEYEVFGTRYGSSVDVSRWIDTEHLVDLNLLDKVMVMKVIRQIQPDYVIHLAALSSPKASFDKPQETLVNNISAQVHLFEALLKLKEMPDKVLIMGSAEEYGYVNESDCPIDESVDLKPANPYAVSKIAQDYLGYQYFISHQLPVVRLRPFNHTGERRPDTFVLPAFAKQIALIEAEKQKPVVRVGNLSPVRDFTDVKDMIRAYELALSSTTPGEVYNIGSGIGIEIQELLDILLGLTDRDVQIEVDDTLIKPVDMPVLIADNTKFVNVSGWQPEIPLQETVKRVLDYWREQINGSQKLVTS